MYLATVSMPRRVRLRGFFSAIRTENFEKFSRPQNFRSEIACDRAEIRVVRRRLASQRFKQVRDVS